ncbi:Predicted metalloprotease with chaperone activity (RNAse H/HSP70 fold) [Phaffia rhodozyma]|uniref:N(6)-L-threonylcarbamoyladenine synthase n=1 Tax=Phaffia rhodozyma TaxID=264483 RepID=A0A0F7SR26_PHARH|nr:Predicted metalloprotease with chaperone activity (RNAse H/HSP70 fold) [Phaffia rhodozyma]
MDEKPGVIKQALKEANLRVHDIDAYAFTQGPGMFNCLSVSCSSASAMAALMNKPLIGVNHMQGHALTPFITEAKPPEFPFLTCLMSGGHTQLVLATSFDEFEILVDTGSLAIGQCFDRLGAALDLPAPQGYGPALESLALSLPSSDPDIPHFAPLPLPPLSSPLFEFSGILLSLLETLHKISPGSDPKAKHSVDPTGIKQAIQVGAAREFQRSVGEAFVRRIQSCLEKLKEDRGVVIKGLVASGGVASNKYLKQRFQSLEKSCGLRVMFPPISLCTDNAAMIANAAIHRYKAQSFTDLSDTLPRRKWSIEELSRPAGPSGDPAVEAENRDAGGS